MREYQTVLSAVYRPPRESTIYADISVDAAVVEAFLNDERKAGRRATVTAVVALAAAHALRTVPDANVVRRRGRFRPRDDVSTWIYGTTDAGDVSGVLVRHLGGGLADVQARVDASSRRHPGANRSGRKAYSSLARMGTAPVRSYLWALSIWLHDLGRRGGRGLDARGFGSIGITNVGSIGIPTAPAIPIPPFMRHVALISVGALHDQAWVRDGGVVAGRRLPMTASLDHRAFMGLAAGQLMAAFQHALTDPVLLRRLARGAPA